ncbi:isoprenoid synthase domain-containing protein [Armillaria nabsnona]|nr:isoprenoid synthase domain-containing protein [Armillaria nabsnona]
MDVLKPYLTIGINIAVSAFHHLDDAKVKMYIVFFNMFTIYLDDACPNDPDARDGIPNFTQHFMSSEKQPSKILNDVADLLNETSRYFGNVAAYFIVQSALKFITALILEGQDVHEPPHKIEAYAMFLRDLTGVADACTMFIFPNGIPWGVSIKALPCLRNFINFLNDVLSFYKEECAGETNNLVSVLADARRENKRKALRYMAEECIKAYEGALRILLPHEEAHGAFKAFARGYLAFHLLSRRYRLSEVSL